MTLTDPKAIAYEIAHRIFALKVPSLAQIRGTEIVEYLEQLERLEMPKETAHQIARDLLETLEILPALERAGMGDAALTAGRILGSLQQR